MRLREIRKNKRLSVPALSRLSGISRRTIEDIEVRGDCRVSTAVKLSRVLGVSMDEFCLPKDADAKELADDLESVADHADDKVNEYM